MFGLKNPPANGGSTPIGPDSSWEALEPRLHEVTAVEPKSLKEPIQVAVTEQQLKTLGVFNDSIKYNFSISTPGDKISGLLPKEAHAELLSARTVALGDIHGSYEKLVETLITSGLATMPPDKAARFVELSAEFEDFISKNPFLEDDPKIWQTAVAEGSPILSKAMLMHAELSDILKKVTWTGGSDRQLILIGDVLADRGVTDTLTLQLLSQLSKDSPDRFVRLTSNHDHCAISYLLTGDTHKLMQNPASRLSYAESQIRAFKLSEDREGLVNQYREHIKELKLLHYDRNSKTLYSHAPITPDQFKSLIETLKEYNYLGTGFEYENLNQETIEDFVGLANQFYQDSISTRFEYGFNEMDAHVEALVNSDPKGFVWPRTKYQTQGELPLLNGAVEIVVHGHAQSSRHASPFSIDFINDKSYPNFKDLAETNFAVVCLDNEVRKTPGKDTPGAESPLFMIR